MSNEIILRSNKTEPLTFAEADANFTAIQTASNTLNTFISGSYASHLTDFSTLQADFNSFKVNVSNQLANIVQKNVAQTFSGTNTFQSVVATSIDIDGGTVDNVIIGDSVQNDVTFKNLTLKVGFADFSLGKYLRIPQWTNTTRPTAQLNEIGFNTDSGKYESYNGTVWEFFYTSSNAGTAATHDVVTSSIDQTDGRILLTGTYGIGNGIVIPSGADLNTYVIPGDYAQPSTVSAQAGSNYPTALAGALEVRHTTAGTGNGVVQRYTVYNNPDRSYARVFNTDTSTWSSWNYFMMVDEWNTNLNTKLNKTGGTITGSLTVNGTINSINAIYTGGGASIFQNDGNISGSAYGGYFSTWANSIFTAIINNTNSRKGTAVSNYSTGAYGIYLGSYQQEVCGGGDAGTCSMETFYYDFITGTYQLPGNYFLYAYNNSSHYVYGVASAISR